MTSKGDQQISRKQRSKIIVIYPIYYFLNVTGMISSFPLHIRDWRETVESAEKQRVRMPHWYEGKHENRGNIISEEVKQKVRNRFFFCSIIASDIKGSVRESKRYYVKVLR